jgi:hypothetical protein
MPSSFLPDMAPYHENDRRFDLNAKQLAEKPRHADRVRAAWCAVCPEAFSLNPFLSGLNSHRYV